MRWYAARLAVFLCPAAGLAAVFSASTLYGDSTMASHEYYVAGFGDVLADKKGALADVVKRGGEEKSKLDDAKSKFDDAKSKFDDVKPKFDDVKSKFGDIGAGGA